MPGPFAYLLQIAPFAGGLALSAHVALVEIIAKLPRISAALRGEAQ